MGFFTYIKKYSWINYIIVSIFLIGFALSQFSGIIEHFTSKTTDEPDFAVIAGNKVDKNRYDQILYQARAEIEQLASQGIISKERVEPWAHIYAWRYFLDKNLYTATYKKLGLEVPQEEQVTVLEEARDLSYGILQQPYIREAHDFKDKKGDFDPTKWRTHLKELSQRNQGEYIKFFEAKIKQERLKRKFTYLIETSLHTTRLEASQYPGNVKIDIAYVYIPYTSLASKEDVTLQEKKDYLKAHAKEYQLQESRTIEFVTLPITPSKEDENALKEEMKELSTNFEQTVDPREFAQSHTDQPKEAKLTWWKLSNMPPIVKTQLETFKKSKVIGPIQDGNTYKLYRMISYKDQHYTVAQIEKSCKPSEYTIHEHFQKAKAFQKVKTPEEFHQKAKQQGLTIETTTLVKGELQATIGTKSIRRSILRWTFNHKNKKIGSVSEPIDANNGHIVCMIKKTNPAGTASLDEVSHKIEAKIRSQKISEQITSKLQPLIKQHKSLKKIAQAYGKAAKVYICRDLSFEKNELLHAGYAPKAIGSAFALKENEKTKIIADQLGIFIIKRLANPQKDFRSATLIGKQQKKLLEKEKKQIPNDLENLFLEETEVEDNRHLSF